MIKMGLVLLGADNFYAEELDILRKTKNALSALLQAEEVEIFCFPDLVITRNQAGQADRFLHEMQVDCILLQASSFFDGNLVASFGNHTCPILLWGIEDLDKEHDVKLHSLLSMLMMGSIAHHSFGPKYIYDWYYGNVTSASFYNKFLTFVRAFRAKKRLEETIIGRIGKTAEGFVNMDVGLEESASKFGYSYKTFSIQEIITLAQSYEQSLVNTLEEIFLPKLGIVQTSAVSMERTIRLYMALKEIVEKYHLTALTVDCWPEFQSGFQIVPCVALSLINDVLDVPVSCEGDMQGVVSMIVLRAISGKTSMVYDIADILIEEKKLLLWHCGIATKSLMDLDGKTCIVNHPMLNRKLGTDFQMGCSFDGVFKQQPLTAFRIQNSSQGIFSITGEVQPASVKGFTGTRGWLGNIHRGNKPISLDSILDSIMRNGVEHHLAVVPGSWDAEIQEFSKLMGLVIL